MMCSQGFSRRFWFSDKRGGSGKLCTLFTLRDLLYCESVLLTRTQSFYMMHLILFGLPSLAVWAWARSRSCSCSGYERHRHDKFGHVLGLDAHTIITLDALIDMFCDEIILIYDAQS